jgi:hypothetical protein
MRYISTLDYVRKGWPGLAKWLEETIGAANTQFAHRSKVNDDLSVGPQNEHAALAQGGILIWIASGRPENQDGWGSKADTINMFKGMTDSELRSYLKSNDVPIVPPPPQPRVAVTNFSTQPVQHGARSVQVASGGQVASQNRGIPVASHGHAGPVAVQQPALLRRRTPPPQPHQPVAAVAVPTTAKNKVASCLPDLGPQGMTKSPKTLIDSKRQALVEIAKFAVGDATTFRGDELAKAKEKALRGSKTRLGFMQAAEQTAGGKIHFRQADLESVHGNTLQAQGAVCTTFAMCAAHILTNGKRQSGDVRVEIIGVDRKLATHMFVVCGRAGNDLATFSTWGPNAVIVDLWAAAIKGHSKFDCAATDTDWRLTEGPLGQFYDSARVDPTQDELSRTVNAGALDRNQLQRELQRLRDELKGTAEFAKAKRQQLSEKITDLETKLKS